MDSQSALPSCFLAAVFLGHEASSLSVVVEDECPAVAERDFFGLLGGAYSFANRRRSRSYGGQEATAHRLVEAPGLCAGGVPFLVEPVQARVFVRDPFLDGLPGRLDGLHGVIRPPHLAVSPFGLRLHLRPKRLRSLGVVQCRRAGGGGRGRGRWMILPQRTLCKLSETLNAGNRHGQCFTAPWKAFPFFCYFCGDSLQLYD